MYLRLALKQDLEITSSRLLSSIQLMSLSWEMKNKIVQEYFGNLIVTSSIYPVTYFKTHNTRKKRFCEIHTALSVIREKHVLTNSRDDTNENEFQNPYYLLWIFSLIYIMTFIYMTLVFTHTLFCNRTRFT